MRKSFFYFGAALLSASILAGCQSRGPSGPQAALEPVKESPKPKVNTADIAGINGKWVPTSEAARKVYYNEFRNGKFRSKSPDGATTIASGNYKAASDGSIRMSWYSEARKAVSSASCRKLSDAEMQCSSNGSVFNLRRA